MPEKKITDMRKLFPELFLTSLCLLILSCNREDGKCFSSFGQVVTETRETGSFDSIAVYDYVNVFLIQDTLDQVTVETGRNIIQGISTTVVNRQLQIRNYNQCNWLRDYSKPVNVHVSVKNLHKIFYNSSGNLITLNAISSDNLWVDLWGGCGSVDITLNIHSGTFIQHQGTADLTLRGLCRICSLYAGDFGPFRCENLVTGYTFITSSSSNDCYVMAERVLDVTILSVGNVYFRGDPDTLRVKIQGSGKLIPY